MAIGNIFRTLLGISRPVPALSAAMPGGELGDHYRRIAEDAVRAVGSPYARILVHSGVTREANGHAGISLMILFARKPGDVAESYNGSRNGAVLDAIEALRGHLQATGQDLWTMMSLVIDGTSFKADLSYETGAVLDVGTWERAQQLKQQYFGQAA